MGPEINYIHTNRQETTLSKIPHTVPAGRKLRAEGWYRVKVRWDMFWSICLYTKEGWQCLKNGKVVLYDDSRMTEIDGELLLPCFTSVYDSDMVRPIRYKKHLFEPDFNTDYLTRHEFHDLIHVQLETEELRLLEKVCNEKNIPLEEIKNFTIMIDYSREKTFVMKDPNYRRVLTIVNFSYNHTTKRDSRQYGVLTYY